jgi:hypothetical protein
LILAGRAQAVECGIRTGKSINQFTVRVREYALLDDVWSGSDAQKANYPMGSG